LTSEGDGGAGERAGGGRAGDERAVRAVVSGRVQGVGYRFATAREARVLGVRGTVRNLPDGRVEVVAEGRRSAVAALLHYCARGPLGALVDRVDVEEFAPGAREFSGFQIRS
jgi:acylphosphatase